MKVATINDLLNECKKQKAKGNGNKKILISNDDEGNGFHQLFYGFTPIINKDGKNMLENCHGTTPCDIDVKNYIILG